MKKFVLCLFCCLVSLSANAQLQSGASDYLFTGVFDSDGDETEMPGHPNKINIMVVTTNFFGISQTNCSYGEYDLMTGNLRGYITLYSYRGVRNGWHIYSWNGNFVYIKNDWSKVRVQMTFYKGNYCEYRKMKRDEDINDAATW